MKEPPIPIPWGKKKRKKKGTSRLQLVVFKNLKEPTGLHERTGGSWPALWLYTS
jgi:hypothetical protein